MREQLQCKGITCIFPEGVKIKYMGWFGKLIAGSMTPAMTYNQSIHFNKDILALCIPETMVHESVHIFQERRMGKMSFWFTYFWQSIVSLFRKGPSGIHQDHLMEREARDVAKHIIEITAGQTEIDIEKEIKTLMGW